MINTKNTCVEPTIKGIFARFFDGIPVSAKIINTSIGDTDFRITAIVETADAEKCVIKLAENDFTFPDKIRMWQRTVEEYRALGYYCPKIIADKNGEFPIVDYCDHSCVAYAEEFSAYRPIEDRADDGDGPRINSSAYFEDIWRMTAKIAAKMLDYGEYSSAYCLFEKFCPSDEHDEVLDNALEWKEYASALPSEFALQVERIWRLWCENRESLKKIYGELPTSVFQADLNPTNLLVDENGVFRGIYDFNLCGKDVFLNYLMRENHDDFEKELEMIRKALKIACGYYVFSEKEKAAALPLYRCLKPLWYNRVEDLKDAGSDKERIQKCLDLTEYYLTADIDFASYME